MNTGTIEPFVSRTETVRRLYAAGHPVGAIAETVQMKKQAVHVILSRYRRKNGIPRQPVHDALWLKLAAGANTAKFPPAQKALLREIYDKAGYAHALATLQGWAP